MAKYVKYIGTSHVRIIKKSEWLALPMPVKDQDTLTWYQGNGWTVPADSISDAAWPYIEADDEMIIVDTDSRVIVKDDSDEVDVKSYPPLTTAAQAEMVDKAEETSDDKSE